MGKDIDRQIVEKLLGGRERSLTALLTRLVVVGTSMIAQVVVWKSGSSVSTFSQHIQSAHKDIDQEAFPAP